MKESIQVRLMIMVDNKVFTIKTNIRYYPNRKQTVKNNKIKFKNKKIRKHHLKKIKNNKKQNKPERTL